VSPLLGEVPSPPVTLHGLLAGFQFGDWTADLAFGFQVLAGALYLLGVRRLSRRERRWPAGRTLAFFSGLVVLFVALVSGLGSYDDSVFSVHVIQHLLIMMVAPPLLSLGAPITLALQASSRSAQTRLLRVLHSAPVVVLTMPLVAAPLYYLSMWADTETSLYPYSLTHPLAHSASHLVLFTFGCLFWWPVIGLDRLPRQPHRALRLFGLGLGMPAESFLGIALMSASRPIAPEHTLADTHTGGSLFWFLSMAVTAAAMMVIGSEWLRSEQRATERESRRQTPRPATAAWAAAWEARAGSPPPILDGRVPEAPVPEGAASLPPEKTG
jgi:cytochrome c oxidase assembly factor CtaG